MIISKDEAQQRIALLRRYLGGAVTTIGGKRWGPEMRGRAEDEIKGLESFLNAKPNEPLPQPGDEIDAWPDSKLAERAPYRECKVLEVTDEHIVLEGGAEIPRKSAWRRSEKR
jgi:hypothetical protein